MSGLCIFTRLASEYVSEVPVNELIIDPRFPRGETLEQWVSRFNRAYPNVLVTAAVPEPVQIHHDFTKGNHFSNCDLSPKGGVGNPLPLTLCGAAASKGKALL